MISSTKPDIREVLSWIRRTVRRALSSSGIRLSVPMGALIADRGLRKSCRSTAINCSRTVGYRKTMVRRGPGLCLKSEVEFRASSSRIALTGSALRRACRMVIRLFGQSAE